MQMNYILTSGAFMQVIHILCDHRQLVHMPGELGDSQMRTIWLRLQNLMPAPFIPSPTETRICAKCLRSRKLCRIKTLPQPCQCITECRDAALS